MRGNDMTHTKARPGDLIVVHVHPEEIKKRGGWSRFYVGVVTSITRDDVVATWRRAGESTPRNLDDVMVLQYWIMTQDKVDVTAALDTAASNPWPHAPEHKGMPYRTMDEVREALRPHRK
jgi:hypothetical protein